AFGAYLAVEFANLGAKFLDTRMLVEQSRRLLGELCAQRHALFGEPTDRFRIGDVGGFDRLAGAQQFTQLSRSRLEVSLLSARRRNLRIDFRQLLVWQCS